MEDILDLLECYDKSNHVSIVPRFDAINIKTVYSNKWREEKCAPLAIVLNVLDSLYCMPERPDMAFTHLWKAINGAYNNLSYKNKTISGKLRDHDAINFSINGINSVLDVVVDSNDGVTVNDIFIAYANAAPIKIMRFFSNYVIKTIIGYRCGCPAHLMNHTGMGFRAAHPILFNAIEKTYGVMHTSSSANVSVCKTRIDYVFKDGVNARAITNEAAKTLKECLVTLTASPYIPGNKNNSISMNISREDRVRIMIDCILYASRNNSFHGNHSPRLTSVSASKDSVIGSIYLYILGTFYMSLTLFLSGEINASELRFNIENVKNFISRYS